MKKGFCFLALAFLMASCNSGADKKGNSEKESNFYYIIDSTATEPPGDSLEVVDTRRPESGGVQKKRDNMKDSLKVSFPDKKK